MVIMPGEALVVNLARPAHALRAPVPGTLVRGPRQAPRSARDNFETPPDEGRGEAVDLCRARGRCGSGPLRQRPPSGRRERKGRCL